MRDTIGAIHNLQHLLASVRVGPKALGRAVPDVQASCAPMVAAMDDLVEAVRGGRLELESGPELTALVTSRLGNLERALGRARGGSLGASERLRLESAVAGIVRDLDGALTLVELVVEASADGAVPVAVGDIISESRLRRDFLSGRAGSLSATFEEPEAGLFILANPRLCLRLLLLGAALAADEAGVVHVAVRPRERACVFELSAGPGPGVAGPLPAARLTPFAGRWATDLARASGAAMEARPGQVMLTLPRAFPE